MLWFLFGGIKKYRISEAFDLNNIIKKFETTIYDFLSNRFSYIFDKYCINSLYLYFVSDAYRIKKSDPDITEEEYNKKMKIKGLKIESFLSIKPFGFKGKKAVINPLLPNPMINECWITLI